MILWLSGRFVDFHLLEVPKSCFGHGGFYTMVIKLSWSKGPWCDLADLSYFSLAMMGPIDDTSPSASGRFWDVQKWGCRQCPTLIWGAWLSRSARRRRNPKTTDRNPSNKEFTFSKELIESINRSCGEEEKQRETKKPQSICFQILPEARHTVSRGQNKKVDWVYIKLHVETSLETKWANKNQISMRIQIFIFKMTEQ